MNTTIKKMTALFLITTSISLNAQSSDKPSLAVMNMDVKSMSQDPSTMSNHVRMEIEKLNMYEVKDKYDVQQILNDNKLNMASCFGKTCLVEVGKILKADKMLTGSMERFEKYIIITYRLIDVNNNSIEKTYVHEFLNLPEELKSMIKLSVAEMFGQEFDKNQMSKLSKPYAFDNLSNNPTQERLRLSGPRFGFAAFTGKTMERIKAPKEQGGMEGFPMMFQFGYQFEKQYLNEGRVQALFEFIPLITGLDQGYFIPSLTLLNGFRDNVNGWEFAFGPTVNLTRVSDGYFDNGVWHQEQEWGNDPVNYGKENPNKIERGMLDMNGQYRLVSGLVFAVGRTFKSGKLNIPVNMYVVPGKHGVRFGMSLGFNAKGL